MSCEKCNGYTKHQRPFTNDEWLETRLFSERLDIITKLMKEGSLSTAYIKVDDWYHKGLITGEERELFSSILDNKCNKERKNNE